MPKKPSSYPVSASLGSLLETYILDGLSDAEGPDEQDLRDGYLAVTAGYDRAAARITIPEDRKECVRAAVIWALNSLGGEPKTSSTGRVTNSLFRSGEAFLTWLSPPKGTP